MASPVVVDGLLSLEKLEELLALEAEHAELDFKGSIDLKNGQHRLGLVKDIIAMMNTPTGGYLLLGASDDGTFARDLAPLDARSFDSAELAQHVSKYIDVPPQVTSKAHVIEGHTLVLIHVAPPAGGLPAIVTTIGDVDTGNGKMKTVLREGTLYVRQGTQTVTATNAHWPMLLERYRAAIVADAREGIDALIRRVVSSMNAPSEGVRLAPLDLDMDDQSFLDAVEQHLAAESNERSLKQFVRRTRSALDITSPRDTRENAMTKMAIIAIAALGVDARAVFPAAIDALHEAYLAAVGTSNPDSPPNEKAEYWLQIILRLLCVGAATVREKAWWAITPMVDRAVDDYYLIWIRHGLTIASRAGYLNGGERGGATLLSQARDLAMRHPSLRPDIGLVAVSDDGSLPASEPLLGSLCEFDFIWCVVALASHPDTRDGRLFYPSCSAFSQHRTEPMISALASSEEIRHELLPGCEPKVIAESIGAVFDVAVQQSHQFAGPGWWMDRLSVKAAKFLERYGV